MKIGELAERSGCLVETIRYYERAGLLAPPARSANNYRSYNEGHAERLQFILHCRALDMTQGEIRVLLDLRDHPERDCAGANALLDQHIGHVVERIADLALLETQLRQLRSFCSAGDAANQTASACGILQALGENAPGDAPRLGVHGAALDVAR